MYSKYFDVTIKVRYWDFSDVRLNWRVEPKMMIKSQYTEIFEIAASKKIDADTWLKRTRTRNVVKIEKVENKGEAKDFHTYHNISY